MLWNEKIQINEENAIIFHLLFLTLTLAFVFDKKGITFIFGDLTLKV